MAMLNLDDPNVSEIEITREDAREYFRDGILPEEVEIALDKAQGDASRASPQYLVIKIN